MKKRVSLLLIIILVLSLAACGKEEESDGKGKSRDTGKATLTPTAEPTAEPTLEPTFEPTPEPTAMPQNVVYEGPSYAIGHGDGCDRYTEWFTGGGLEGFQSDLDYLYITEAGHDALAKTIREQNLEAYNRNDRTRNSAAELFEELTTSFSSPWYEWNTITVWRCDSVLFSYARTDTTYLGGAQDYTARTGYTIETKTGERVDIATVITDMKAFSADIVTLLAPSADKLGLWDNWEEKVNEGIAEGNFGWVATDDGLQIWFNNGYLAPYVTGEVCVEYNVEDFYDRFVPEYVGAYGDNMKTARVPNPDPNPRSREYIDLLTYLTVNFRMNWRNTADYLDSIGIEYDGMDDEEAALNESDAYMVFLGPDTNDRFFIYYWPDDDDYANIRQTIDSINIKLPEYEFFMYICMSDDGFGGPVYNIVDCSLDGRRDAVTFTEMDTALSVLFTTMLSYYSDITAAYPER